MPLQRREVPHLRDRAGTDHDLGRSRQDRGDELRDVIGAVLVVGVRVDDDVSACVDGGFEANEEGPGETLMAREADDVIDAVRSRDLGRPILARVIDDSATRRCQYREAGGGERRGSPGGLFLVVTGDLNDQFHRLTAALRGHGSLDMPDDCEPSTQVSPTPHAWAVSGIAPDTLGENDGAIHSPGPIRGLTPAAASSRATQSARPMTRSRSCPESHGSSSVNIVTHCRHEHGMRVMSVPQNMRSGPKAS